MLELAQRLPKFCVTFLPWAIFLANIANSLVRKLVRRMGEYLPFFTNNLAKCAKFLAKINKKLVEIANSALLPLIQ